jgi:hypothetical protein
MIRKWILRKLLVNPAECKAHIHDCETPKAGEAWIRVICDSSPWPKHTMYEVKIIDVKNGWVRYYMSDFFPDERMKVDIFTMIYINKTSS